MKEISSTPPLERRHREALDAAVEALERKGGGLLPNDPTRPKFESLLDSARQALWLLKHGATYRKESK